MAVFALYKRNIRNQDLFSTFCRIIVAFIGITLICTQMQKTKKKYNFQHVQKFPVNSSDTQDSPQNVELKMMKKDSYDKKFYENALATTNEANLNRAKRISKRVSDRLQNLNSKTKILTNKSMPTVTALFKDVVFQNLDLHDAWHKDPILKNFAGDTKFYLLHKIMKKTLTGKPCYKEKLCTYKNLGVSIKTGYKILDELVQDGYLIYMDAFDTDEKRNTKNIRPSEDVAVAYTSLYLTQLEKQYNHVKDFLNENKPQ